MSLEEVRRNPYDRSSSQEASSSSADSSISHEQPITSKTIDIAQSVFSNKEIPKRQKIDVAKHKDSPLSGTIQKLTDQILTSDLRGVVTQKVRKNSTEKFIEMLKKVNDYTTQVI